MPFNIQLNLSRFNWKMISVFLILTLALSFLFYWSRTEHQPMIVGGDRDAHGCIGSAGYAWCESTQQCERPWELASQKGFENSGEAFNKFCSGSNQE